MTRVAEIADYLLSTGIGDTEAAVQKTIAARWPDASEVELDAALLTAIADAAIQVLDAIDTQTQAAATAAIQA